MTGADSQDLGDWGADQVRAALSGRGFVLNEFNRDVGEDFLVELGGRGAAVAGAPPPRQAYLQIRAHQERARGDFHSERIERKHLVRYAFQRLPVFLVSVTDYGLAPRTFLRSIDDYLTDNPRSLAPDCVQRTFAVRAEYTPTLASTLREQIEAFYVNSTSNVSKLDDVAVANHHIEFVGERGDLYPQALVRMDSWRAIYKSTPRPANLRAVVDFIAERVRRGAGGARPSQVSCFLYRSLAALGSNQWVARVVWSEAEHVDAPPSWTDKAAIEVTARPNTLDIERFVKARTAGPVTFDAYLRPLARRADALAERVLQAEGEDPWPDNDVQELRALDGEWNDGPHAPPQLRHVSDFFCAFLQSLETHRWTAQDSIDVPVARRSRWSKQEFEKLSGFRGAVDLLLDLVAKE